VCPDCGYRMDLLVEDKLIIELKSVEQIKGAFSQGHLRGAIADLHAARGSEDRSPLMNFNPTNSKGGIKRFVLLRALRCARLSLADLVDWPVSVLRTGREVSTM